MSRVFSGIQPTLSGVPHLGNYFGALKNYVRMQTGNEAYYCVVDQHATTVAYNPSDLKTASLVTAAALLACGVDAEQSVLFKQSQVPAHSMLAQVLSLSIASMGPLERMTQFKDKSEQQAQIENGSVGLGLFTYPVLMAADILLYHADLVPVGNDQHQHLQLTGELAQKFNHRFKQKYFKRPRAIFSEFPRIMSLYDPTKKMSKSDSNPLAIVFLSDSMDKVNDKYKRATSDTDFLPSEPKGLENRLAAKNLLEILAAMKDQTLETVCQEFGNQNFSTLKKSLIEAHENMIFPIGKRMDEILTDKVTLSQTLTQGAEKARIVSEKTIKEVYNIVGF